MNTTEALRRPTGYIDFHSENGGRTLREDSANLILQTERAAGSASSAVLMALSVRALDQAKDDLVKGYRRRNKLIFSKGVGKLSVGVGLFVLSGILGSIALEANRNIDALKNHSI